MMPTMRPSSGAATVRGMRISEQSAVR